MPRKPKQPAKLADNINELRKMAHILAGAVGAQRDFERRYRLMAQRCGMRADQLQEQLDDLTAKLTRLGAIP
jgi:hypothetical protein